MDKANTVMMSSARLRRHAFTLLELLAVVAIIAILVGMLTIAGIKMIGTSKVSSTRVTLNVLQNMLAEFDAKTRLSPAPPYWLWSEDGATPTYEPLPANAGLNLNFWKVPFKVVGPPVQYDSLCAPQIVDTSSETELQPNPERNGSIAVYNTALMMPLLLNLPSNRATIEKLTADRLFTPKWMSTSPSGNEGKIKMPGTDRVLMTGDDAAAQNPSYYQGAIVEYTAATESHPRRYRAVVDPGAATPSPTSQTPWLELPNAAPMLLDAWNNPIILVPGSGLRVRLLNGEKDYLKNGIPPNSANLGITIVMSPEGQVDTSIANLPFAKKPGRPFFASAGPDGNFTTGDDNLYSFEQQ